MKTRQLLIAFSLCGLAAALLADESKVPLSDFRKYFWGARQAYEDRHFDKAQQLLKIYKERGSHSDPLMKLAGCDPTWEVSVFTEALKESQACLAHRSTSAAWTDPEQAKLIISQALQSQDFSTLVFYVDCAPMDLVPVSTTCGTHTYRKAADINRLIAAIKKYPDIVQKAEWREFPAKADDPQHVRWMLYPTSDRWKPCGMEGSPIVSLRQDPSGQIRIAGFAASCLGTEKETP